MKRRFSALLLAGLGTAALVVGSAGERSEAAPVDPEAADRYLARLDANPPRVPGAAAGKEAPVDPKLVKTAARLDRAEPVVGAVFSVIR